MSDLINPDHYKRPNGEVINFIRAVLERSGGRSAYRGYLIGNYIKYLQRAGLKLYPEMDSVKSKEVDLQKAEWFLNKLKEYEGENKSTAKQFDLDKILKEIQDAK